MLPRRLVQPWPWFLEKACAPPPSVPPLRLGTGNTRRRAREQSGRPSCSGAYATACGTRKRRPPTASDETEGRDVLEQYGGGHSFPNETDHKKEQTAGVAELRFSPRPFLGPWIGKSYRRQGLPDCRLPEGLRPQKPNGLGTRFPLAQEAGRRFSIRLRPPSTGSIVG